MTTTFDRISSIIGDITSRENFTQHSSLIEDCDMDSLDYVELFMVIEDEFEVVVDDESARNWLTIGDVVSYVDKAVADKELSACD